MGVIGFSHLSVQVRDIDKVLPFYRDLLGLKVSIDREKSFSARNKAGEMVHYERRELYLRWQEGPGASYVVLGQSRNHEMQGAATPLQEIGFDHVSFMVDNVDAIAERAKELGYEILSGPNTNDGPANAFDGDAAVRTVLLYDPENNIVQVDQWLPVEA